MLMRNDIAFIEAAYGAMWLGAYAVPVNWHFKPEEIDFRRASGPCSRQARSCLPSQGRRSKSVFS
jgi:acyl-CoA synthetase (AMP-forming)/AMP-acid ligase II